MLRLRQRGGAHQRAYNEACRIISSLGYGVEELNKLTNHGESRIDHCVKYDISNDAHRLVTVHSKNCVYLLFVGTHEEVDRWLERNRGLEVTLNLESKRVVVTHVTREERRETPRIDFAKTQESNTPYMERIGFDPSEVIPQRVLVRAVNQVNDDTSEEELEDLLADLNDGGQEVANLIMDVIFEIREGRLEGACARIDKFREAASKVQEDPAQEAEAIRSKANADQVAILTGMSEEQIKLLFSPERFKEWMLWLHPDQREIVDKNYPSTAVLTGVSGSGKTCILVHRAIRLAKLYPDERIGVLTLNRSLSRLLANQVQELSSLQGEDPPDNLHVMAFYDYFSSLVAHFGPQDELDQLGKLAENHPESHHILRVIRQVKPNTYAREFDPLSGEDLDDTWELFCNQKFVRDLIVNVREHLWKYDSYVDTRRYLREEFSLIRSAVPTANRVDGYLKLERNGRAIPFPATVRPKVLDLLLLYEETLMSGGLLDELSLTLALVPHRVKLQDLPKEMRFRSILIDEFQDLSTRDLALLRLIPTAAENGIFLTGDTVQRVMVKDLRMGAVGMDVTRATWEKIKKNYRNSRQILRAASFLAERYGQDAKAQGQEIDVMDPELAMRETSRPSVYWAQDGYEIEAAWRYVSECLNAQSASPWAICIVTACPEIITTSDILQRKPTDLKVPAGQITGDYVRERDSVCVGTMPDVKGFDFSLVVVVGCGSVQLPNPGHCRKEAWRDALRLYVAMTRARDEVVLIYTGQPSEFLEVMREGLTWNNAGASAAENKVHDNIY